MRVQMKPETIARRAIAREIEAVARRERLITRLRANFEAEPDREYAAAVWGAMLENACNDR